MAQFAIELDMAAGLLHEAIDHAETEAGALADPLGGEEGIEGPRPHLLWHALAAVGDGDEDVVAGRQVLDLPDIAGLDRDVRWILGGL
jgi:hypothetical protein